MNQHYFIKDNNNNNIKEQNIGNLFSKLTFELYNKLYKKGKPQYNEWTILSSIIMEYKNENLQSSYSSSFQIISLGTGTACLSKSKLSKEGI